MKATVWANILEKGQDNSRDTGIPETDTESEGKKRARKWQEKGKKILYQLLKQIHT